MILGLSTPVFTLVHVIVSLVAIAAGLVVVQDMLQAKKRGSWTAVFLATMVLTSVTGFFFPSTTFTPAQGVGLVSLVALAIAILAYYVFHLSSAWRWLYVIGAIVALYLDVFVLVVQAFQKIEFLTPFAPTQSEPPFLIAQLIVLAAAVLVGFFAVRRFHPDAGQPLPATTNYR